MLTVDDSKIRNLSQVNISVIHNVELKGKLLGPLQQRKSETKFFASFWRSFLSYLFFRKGLSGSKYILSYYLPETKVMNLFLKTETWVLRSRSK